MAQYQYLIAAVTDLHVNSTVALSKPRITLDDGGDYVASSRQRWLWDNWIDYWKWVKEYKVRLKRELIVWLGGELSDDLFHRSTQLITRNKKTQLRHSVQVLEPMLDIADEILIMRGSEAHAGTSAWMDERIAEDISASPSTDTGNGPWSWWHWQGVIDGITIDGAHHPGTGHGRPWTRGADANRLSSIIKDEYIEVGQWPPDLVLRGHNHKPSDSADNHCTRSIILPSWQLSNAYGYRLGGGWLPTGGLVFWRDADGLNVQKRYHKWPVAKEHYWRPGNGTVYA